MIQCPRENPKGTKCSGTVIFEPIFGEDGKWHDEWRCIQCGERFIPDRPLTVRRKNLRERKGTIYELPGLLEL